MAVAEHQHVGTRQLNFQLEEVGRKCC